MAVQGTPTDTPERAGDTIASATRALVEATTALSRLLGEQVSLAGEDVGDAIATGLREATRGLADASASVESVRAPRTPRCARRRRERVDQTRVDLLDAAARVFAAEGFEGASVDDVAAAAGYTKGAVYAHFASKRELFLTLARERVLSGGEQPDEPAAEDQGGCDGSATSHAGSPDDLAAEIQHQLAASADDPSMLLGLEVLAYAVRHPDVRPEFAGLFADLIDGLAVRVRDDRLMRPGETGTVSSAVEVPTVDDYDSAVGVLAIANVAGMLAAISVAPRLSIDAGSRIVARLLGR